MATVSEKPQSTSSPQRTEEQLVNQQIGRTRRALKMVDLAAGLISLAIGVLAFLLIAAVFEHWVIPGGWSDTARLLLFGLLLAGIGWYSWRTFWPLLGQSINPIYAAQAIEQSSPSLKNSLMNLLLLRSRKRQLPSQVYQAIEQQAAQGLSQVQIESVVDRSAILRLGYILVAMTALCALYRFLSPKDLITSAGRVLAPWTSITTPSRVEILDVTPGDTQVARGEQLNISAEVLGLEADEPVRLIYSTDDEQIVGREIAMAPSTGGTLFSCKVPSRIGTANSGGVQQDFSYRIEAGDAQSPRYQVSVFARPTLVVSHLQYEYPAYTGYPSRLIEHTGDIRAIEGTRVTVVAQANKPIKAAHVDFEADGQRELLMKSHDQQATVTFPLALRDDRRTPRYQSYALRYLTTSGNQNEQPPKYQIDVLPDYSPEIQLLLPEEAMIEVPLNQEVQFEFEARDPDFALSNVILIGQLGEKQIVQKELLAKNHTGRFVGKLRTTPAQLGLKPGDVLEYWGVAADNRSPVANLAYSAHRKLRVIESWRGNPEDQQEQEDQTAPADQDQQGESGNGKQEGQAGGGTQGGGDQGEQSESGESDGGQGSDMSDKSDQQEGQGGSGNSDSENEQNDDSESQGSAEGNSPSGDSDTGDSGTGDSDGSESPQDGNESPNDSDNASGEKPAPGGSGSEQSKVSSDGDDDGSAFEKMAKHFEEQTDPSSEKNAPSDSSSADGKPQPDNQPTTDPGAHPNTDENTGKSESGDPETDPAKSDAANTEQPPGPTDEQAAGDPATGEGSNQGKGQEQSPSEGKSPDSPRSPEQDDNPADGNKPSAGESGAGDNSGNQQGAPESANPKHPQEKPSDSDSAEGQQKNPEAPAESHDQSESDSESSQGGDRSGGGKEGAGQQAKQSGKGGAGKNEAADEGAGKASEEGDGKTGQQPGDQKKAAGQTGQSSEDQAGNGSKQNPNAGDQAEGKNADDGSQGQQDPQGQSDEPSTSPPTGKPASPDAQSPPGTAGDPNSTGGKPGSPPPSGETQAGDKANLDYARKQTDLILDKLDEQLKNKKVDQSLLEKLGWTQDELQRFVDRWKNLKSKANPKTGTDESNNELNDALRSLGLGRNRRTGYRSQVGKDKLRDLQHGFRGKIPLEYQEQVRSYLKGTAAAQEKK